MSATIKDIANKAQVSIATVSKVLNDKMYVASATREKVLEAIDELNYAPNAMASGLARKNSKTVFYVDKFCKGLAFVNPHGFEILCGIIHEVNRKGYQLSLLNLDDENKKMEELLQEAALNKKADGLIINGAFATSSVERILVKCGFPAVCIGKPSFETTLSWLDTNHGLSSSIAVEHLLSHGCKRIAFIGGLDTDKIFIDRLVGFQVAMEKRGTAVPAEYITYNEPDVSAVERSVRALLSLPVPPDGIICANSLMGVATMNAIHEAGISIPQDISVVIFDDYPYSSIITPAPTVIDIDLFNLGVQVGNSIVKKIKNPSLLIQTYTTLPQLIERNTTNP